MSFSTVLYPLQFVVDFKQVLKLQSESLLGGMIELLLLQFTVAITSVNITILYQVMGHSSSHKTQHFTRPTRQDQTRHKCKGFIVSIKMLAMSSGQYCIHKEAGSVFVICIGAIYRPQLRSGHTLLWGTGSVRLIAHVVFRNYPSGGGTAFLLPLLRSGWVIQNKT